LRRSEWLLYAATLARVENAIENNNVAAAVQLLEQCQWDLRGWEYRYLCSRLSSKATLKGHLSGVMSMAFSPHGRGILTGSLDGRAKGWDAQPGKVVLSLLADREQVNGVAYSPDGRHILTGGSDKTAKVWDAATGKVVLSLNGHRERVNGVAYSPD